MFVKDIKPFGAQARYRYDDWKNEKWLPSGFERFSRLPPDR